MVPETSITAITLNKSEYKLGDPMTVTLQVDVGGKYRTSVDIFDKITNRRLLSTERTESKTAYTLACRVNG